MILDSVINCGEILAFEGHGVCISVCPSGNYDFGSWYHANTTLVYYCIFGENFAFLKVLC